MVFFMFIEEFKITDCYENLSLSYYFDIFVAVQ